MRISMPGKAKTQSMLPLKSSLGITQMLLQNALYVGPQSIEAEEAKGDGKGPKQGCLNSLD